MYWKLIVAHVIAFIITLFLAKFIVGVLQRYLAAKEYKLTKGFSYIITCLIVLVLGIGLGKEFLYTLL